MSFTRETEHTARKAHRCDACQTAIQPGERYIRWAGMFDGMFDTGAYHPDCREEEVRINRENDADEESWMPLHQHVCEEPSILDTLPPAIADRIRAGQVAQQEAHAKWLAEQAGA